MVNTIDMQDLRYLNLFGKITRVKTKFCFKYNEAIIFCVPRNLVPKAVSEGGRNIRQMSGILKRRVKIISNPRGIQDAKSFVKDIVSPVRFNNLEIKDNEIILTAGSRNKAALIGRNKRRLLEMKKIIKGYFGKDFRIV